MWTEPGLPAASGDELAPAPRVVVVNDSPTQLHLLAGFVERAGFIPLTFKSAESALAAMRREAPPSLIVTDLYMPGIDGWRFCRLLRSVEYAPLNHTPLLVVSATFSGEEPARLAAELGAEAFLTAPVDEWQFVGTLQALLKGEAAHTLLRALVAADPDTCRRLLPAFQARGYQVQAALTRSEVQELLDGVAYDVAVLDYRLPEAGVPPMGNAPLPAPFPDDVMLRKVKQRCPDCVCILVASDPPPGLAIAWMNNGAAAFVQIPFDSEYLVVQCERARRERALMHIPELLEQRTRQFQESEERFRQAMEATSDGLWDWDFPNHVVHYSPAYFAMLGYAPGELPAIEQTFQDLLHPDDRQAAWAANLACLQGVIPNLDLEFRLRAKDGTWRWINSRGKVVQRDEGGAALRMVGIHVDITARKQAEAALRQSEERYRELFESSPISMWEEDFTAVLRRLEELRSQGVSDIPGYLDAHPECVTECAALVQVLDVNRASVQLYGARDKHELLRSLTTFLCEDSYATFRQELIYLWDCQRCDYIEFTTTDRTLDGRRLDIRLTWSIPPGAAGGPFKVIVSIIDITASRQAEARIHEQLDELRRWHTVTLGREERILELKNEVNRLLVESGQPPRYTSAAGGPP